MILDCRQILPFHVLIPPLIILVYTHSLFNCFTHFISKICSVFLLNNCYISNSFQRAEILKNKPWIISTALMLRSSPWQSDRSSGLTCDLKRLKDSLGKGHGISGTSIVPSFHVSYHILHKVEDHENQFNRIKFLSKVHPRPNNTPYVQGWAGVMFDLDLRGWLSKPS